MGTDDMAVVDAAGRVHGVQNLRVVDSSIMPDVVSGNLNVPTIMMAEKMADAIRGHKPLQRSTAPAFVHPDYLNQQR
jgi:choline dehydrogenase